MTFRPPLPDEELLALVPMAAPSKLPLGDVWVNEGYEPMVDLREVCPTVHMRQRGRPFLARHQVAERLHQVQVWLDLNRPGLQLEVLEAYRPPASGRAFLRWASAKSHWASLAVRALRRLPLASTSPLATGGTLAVRLRDIAGLPLPMVSTATLAGNWNGGSESIRRHRALLSEAMAQGGFVNALASWWHWSYGDRLWAAVVHQPEACYGDVKRVFSPT